MAKVLVLVQFVVETRLQSLCLPFLSKLGLALGLNFDLGSPLFFLMTTSLSFINTLCPLPVDTSSLSGPVISDVESILLPTSFVSRRKLEFYLRWKRLVDTIRIVPNPFRTAAYVYYIHIYIHVSIWTRFPSPAAKQSCLLKKKKKLASTFWPEVCLGFFSSFFLFLTAYWQQPGLENSNHSSVRSKTTYRKHSALSISFILLLPILWALVLMPLATRQR